MRLKIATASAVLLALGITGPAGAQRAAMDAENKRLAKERAERAAVCDKLQGIAKEDCYDERNQRPIPVIGKQISKADAKLVSDAFAAGNTKRQAQDYAGAIADYDTAIVAVPTHPGIPQIQVSKAAALRSRAVAAFNAGLKPGAPGGQAAAAAAATPDLKAALTAVGAAAAAVKDPAKEAATVTAIGVEFRENASLLYQVDKAGTFSTARPTAATEVDWLRRWLGGSPAPSAADVAKYGYAVAAAEYARDGNAGLALSDEVQAKAGADVDSTIAYGDFIAAAKLPAGDARRTKAAAAITALETGGTTNDQQKAKLRRIKAALTAPA